MQLAINRHVTDDELERYALDNLEEAEFEVIEEHLWMCEPCQEALSAREAYIGGMRTAAREVRRRSAAQGWRFLPVPAWAVSLAALLVLTGMWRLSVHPPIGPPALVVLEATRGAPAPANRVPARHALALTLDLTDLPPLASYDVEIVDAAGRQAFQSTASSANNQLRASLPRGLPAGMYYVRVYNPSRELLREYGLRVGSR